jgi:hypothetical protein
MNFWARGSDIPLKAFAVSYVFLKCTRKLLPEALQAGFVKFNIIIHLFLGLMGLWRIFLPFLAYLYIIFVS